jgi:hypothetical protein
MESIQMLYIETTLTHFFVRLSAEKAEILEKKVLPTFIQKFMIQILDHGQGKNPLLNRKYRISRKDGKEFTAPDVFQIGFMLGELETKLIYENETF